MKMSVYTETLTGEQLQWLIDKFNLVINLEEGEVVAHRKDGKHLAASTIAKMTRKKETPTNWVERDGEVRGI